MTFTEIMLGFIISNASCLLIIAQTSLKEKKKSSNHTTKLHKLSETNQMYACIVGKALVPKNR